MGSLQPGTRLGPYEVSGQIGVGGMGEVYRATDTNLKRAVALKVLPASVAVDAERLARFQREAEVLAALNHPHIASIYGLEKSGPTIALVMELVEGPTLAEVIATAQRGGPTSRGLTLDDALPIARQIANALEAAHEQGIIHRDLKPANVKVRADGTVKVLDFGLAKVLEPAGQAADSSTQQTITSPAMTAHGIILGTAAYMAPEQARGRPVDKRADVWAFGCVLFEMLTGRRAFPGEDVSETLAAVLRAEPEWDALPRETPAPLGRLLRRCLAKDPRQRLGDMSAVRLDIDEAAAPPGTHATAPPARAASTRVGRVAIVASLLAGALLAAAAAWAMWPAPRPPAVVHLTVDIPAGWSWTGPSGSGIALSRDGRTLAFLASGPDGFGLFVRSLDSTEVRRVDVAGRAYAPFFSPDNRELGFFALRSADEAHLWRVPLAGGAPFQIAPVDPVTDRGAMWAPDGFVYVGGEAGVWRTPVSGGARETLTTVDRSAREIAHRFPKVLPGGRGVVFTSLRGGLDEARIGVLDLGTKQVRWLNEAGHAAQYVATGHLVFLRSGALVAAPFDLASLDVTGAPQPVVNDVLFNNGGAGHFDVSDDGVLAYVPGIALPPTTVVWTDRQGGSAPIGVPARSWRDVALSPDGRRLALVHGLGAGENDIQLWDFARQTLTPVARHALGGFDPPVWLSDDEFAFASHERGFGSPAYLVRQRTDGTARPERVSRQDIEALGGSAAQIPGSLSADGTRLFFSQMSTRDDGLRVVNLGTSEVQSLRNVGAQPRISPDGRWLAYWESNNVWVQAYPGAKAARWQISAGVSHSPRWSRDGSELFFRSESRVMVARLDPRSGFENVRPQLLFDAPNTVASFDVSPDGQRFVMLRIDNPTPPVPHVIVNWFEPLRRLGSAK